MNETGGSVRIDAGEGNRLVVRFHYTPERVRKIKTVPGRRWHPEKKYWTVPDVKGMRERLMKLFAEAPPPAPAPASEPKDLMERLRHAIRSRHLSPRTEEASLGR